MSDDQPGADGTGEYPPQQPHDPYALPSGQYPPPTGYPQPGYSPTEAPKTKLAAGLLGIFLGGLGVHRFYLGYTGIGIAQIAVTVLTCGLGSIWGLVEGILYLASAEGSQWSVDAQGRPLV